MGCKKLELYKTLQSTYNSFVFNIKDGEQLLPSQQIQTRYKADMTGQVKFIRYRDAPKYCGMAKAMFDKKIRPLIDTEIHDGPKYVAFDISDLNAALDEYKTNHAVSKVNPSKLNKPSQEIIVCPQKLKVFNTTKEPVNGVSTKESKATEESGSVYKRALKSKLN